MYTWHKQTGTAYVTSGIGYGRTELSAFDAAELDANIIATNAIKVSSFVPPNWQIIDNKDELTQCTTDGIFLPMAYAYGVSNKSKVAASLLIGINEDTTKASIITEHAAVNITKIISLEQAELCLLDIFNVRGWNIDRVYKKAAEADPKDNLFACALVAVIFITDPVITS